MYIVMHTDRTILVFLSELEKLVTRRLLREFGQHLNNISLQYFAPLPRQQNLQTTTHAKRFATVRRHLHRSTGTI